MENGTVVVLCPMDCEWDSLSARLTEATETTETRIGGYRFVEGKIGELPVVAARCLIGNVNAAVCASLATERFSPDCLILQGTAGAHDPTLCKNDIVIAEKIVSLGHTVSPRRKRGEGSDPFAWDDFGVQTYLQRDDDIRFVGEFACDGRLISLARTIPYRAGRVTVGTVGCGDVWNREVDLIRHYRENKGTLCEAMEGVGVAQVCAAFGIPMAEIRVISNSEWREDSAFSADTAENGQKFVWDLLKKIAEIRAKKKAGEYDG